MVVGVVGLGRMGERHARAVAACPDADLLAVCDPGSVGLGSGKGARRAARDVRHRSPARSGSRRGRHRVAELVARGPRTGSRSRRGGDLRGEAGRPDRRGRGARAPGGGHERRHVPGRVSAALGSPLPGAADRNRCWRDRQSRAHQGTRPRSGSVEPEELGPGPQRRDLPQLRHPRLRHGPFRERVGDHGRQCHRSRARCTRRCAQSATWTPARACSG